jgi:hypothetical protein
MSPTIDPRPAVQKRLAELLGQKYEWMATSAKLLKLAKDPKRLDQIVNTLQKDFGVTIDRRVANAARTVSELVTLVGNAVEEGQAQSAPPPPPLPPLPRLPDQLERPQTAAAGAPAASLIIPRAASGETYDSRLQYNNERIHAVALHCSDGRIGEHVDDFLENGLGLPRYDRLACPGGPVALSGRLTGFWECRGVEEQLRFLVKSHELERVVLIAHQPCAYYLGRLGTDPAALESEQRHDLEQAMWEVQRMAPGLEVASFIAWTDGSAVRFEKLTATSELDQRLSRWRARSR